jgi:hypothetical protein
MALGQQRLSFDAKALELSAYIDEKIILRLPRYGEIFEVGEA